MKFSIRQICMISISHAVHLSKLTFKHIDDQLRSDVAHAVTAQAVADDKAAVVTVFKAPESVLVGVTRAGVCKRIKYHHVAPLYVPIL